MTVSRFDDFLDVNDTPFDNLSNIHPTPLGSFRLAVRDSDVFQNAKSNDVILMGLNPEQSIHISPFIEEDASSVFSIGSSNVQVGINLDIEKNMHVHQLATFNNMDLQGTFKTDEILSTSGFTFLNSNQTDAVFHIHENGFFIGGHLHINVDIPKHSVDINGDFACTGPMEAGSTLDVLSNLRIHKDAYFFHDIYAAENHFTLSNKHLYIKHLHADGVSSFSDDVFIEGNTTLTGSFSLPTQDFYIQNNTVIVPEIYVKKRFTCREKRHHLWSASYARCSFSRRR